MVKDILTSFRDNITQKTTNPFLGTFITVWVIKHWKFVYTFFNMDPDFTLSYKISLLEEYFLNYTFWATVLHCVFWTFLILLGTYFLLTLSRLIINSYEKFALPFVYKLTDKNSIVLKSEYKKLYLEASELEAKLIREVELRKKMEGVNENLNKEIEELNKKIASNRIAWTFDPKSRGVEISKVYEKLESEGLFDNFKRIATQIANREDIAMDDVAIKPFLTYGLIEFDSKGTFTNSAYYKFTNLGSAVYHKFVSKYYNF